MCHTQAIFVFLSVEFGRELWSCSFYFLCFHSYSVSHLCVPCGWGKEFIQMVASAFWHKTINWITQKMLQVCCSVAAVLEQTYSDIHYHILPKMTNDTLTGQLKDPLKYLKCAARLKVLTFHWNWKLGWDIYCDSKPIAFSLNYSLVSNKKLKWRMMSSLLAKVRDCLKCIYLPNVFFYQCFGAHLFR